jgi:glycosyltransferase involved in cell wall biosynthesis
MRVAFYAPLKPPDHPVPSGDRRIARLLIQALRAGGHAVDVATRLRSRDGSGDATRQRRIRDAGRRTAARLIDRHRHDPPDVWFTYHLYHKAPDWIGPAVSSALSIPYVAAEPSHAGKQASGPWREGHCAAAAAIAAARRLVVFDPLDLPGLAAVAVPERLVRMPPFLDIGRHAPPRGASRAAMARAHRLDPAIPWLATVAMMRADVKRESYRVLAAALARLCDRPWHLLIAGDGGARADIEALFKPVSGPHHRVVFLGALEPCALARLHAAADLAVWPALEESFSMALLEAQAAGLPVVAGDRQGIAQYVRHGETGLLAPEGDAAALASAMGTLLTDPARRHMMGGRAHRRIHTYHGLPAAARRLDAVLCDARCEGRT